MRWWRSNQRFGVYLALLALALQFIASLAHIHPDGFGSALGGSLSVEASPVLSSAGASDSPAYPLSGRGGLPRHDCAVCISVALLGSALEGQPPALSLPTDIGLSLACPASEFQFLVIRFCAFRTRAPPVV
jgi:hypothetical protein